MSKRLEQLNCETRGCLICLVANLSNQSLQGLKFHFKQGQNINDVSLKGLFDCLSVITNQHVVN